MPDLMPLTPESRGEIKRRIEAAGPVSVRINTQLGDFWFNLQSLGQSSRRMGVLSHVWTPGALAMIIATTNAHYCSVPDLKIELDKARPIGR
jgi:hypothetical protein